MIDLLIPKIIYHTSTITLSCLWLKQRILNDDFLNGRWSGCLCHEDSQGNNYDLVTEVDLIVSRHKDKSNSAYLVYEKRDIQNNTLISRGLDELIDHGQTSSIDNSWNPKFRRLFHHNIHQVNNNDAIYNFECFVSDRIFKQKMSVSVKLSNDYYLKGIIEKN